MKKYLTEEFLGREFISYETINDLVPGDSQSFLSSLFHKEILDAMGNKIKWEPNANYYLIKIDTLLTINRYLNTHLKLSSVPTSYFEGFVFLKSEHWRKLLNSDVEHNENEYLFSIKPTKYSLIDNKKHELESWITFHTEYPIIENYKNDPDTYQKIKGRGKEMQMGINKIIYLIPKYVELDHFLMAYSLMYGGDRKFPDMTKRIVELGYMAGSKENTSKPDKETDKKNANTFNLMELITKFEGFKRTTNIVVIVSVLKSFQTHTKSESITTNEFCHYLTNNAKNIDAIYEVNGDSILLSDGESMKLSNLKRAYKRII